MLKKGCKKKERQKENKGCTTSQGISEENGIHANGVTQCLEKKN